MSKHIDDSLEWHDENELIRKLDAVEAVLNMADKLDDVVDILLSVPSIDIVRCKECRYKSLYDDGETKYYYCALEDRPNRQWSVDDTDFCSWGERKE